MASVTPEQGSPTGVESTSAEPAQLPGAEDGTSGFERTTMGIPKAVPTIWHRLSRSGRSEGATPPSNAAHGLLSVY